MQRDPENPERPIGGVQGESRMAAPFQGQIQFDALIQLAADAAGRAAAREMGDVVRELNAVMTEYPRVYPVVLAPNVANKFVHPWNPQYTKRFPFSGSYALDHLELLRHGAALASQVDIGTPWFTDPLSLSSDKTSLDLGITEFGGMELSFTNNDPVNGAVVIVRFKKVWSAEAWERAGRTP